MARFDDEQVQQIRDVVTEVLHGGPVDDRPALPSDLPNIEDFVYEGQWSLEYDYRSGGRILTIVRDLRRKLLNDGSTRAAWLLKNPALTYWTITTDTPAAGDAEAEFQREANASPLDDLLIPGGGAKIPFRDIRLLRPRIATRYKRSGTHRVTDGSFEGVQVLEKMDAFDAARLLTTLVDQVLTIGIPPNVGFTDDFPK